MSSVPIDYIVIDDDDDILVVNECYQNIDIIENESYQNIYNIENECYQNIDINESPPENCKSHHNIDINESPPENCKPGHNLDINGSELEYCKPGHNLDINGSPPENCKPGLNMDQNSDEKAAEVCGRLIDKVQNPGDSCAKVCGSLIFNSFCISLACKFCSKVYEDFEVCKAHILANHIDQITAVHNELYENQNSSEAILKSENLKTEVEAEKVIYVADKGERAQYLRKITDGRRRRKITDDRRRSPRLALKSEKHGIINYKKL